MKCYSLLSIIALGLVTAHAQGTIDLSVTLSGSKSLPDSTTVGELYGSFALEAGNSLSGSLYIPVAVLDYRTVDFVRIYESSSANQLGNLVLAFEPSSINAPDGQGGAGGRFFRIDETLSSQEASDLSSGLWWVNVETQSFPGGATRGQITVVPEPTTIALFVLGGVALFARPWLSRAAKGQ